MKKEKNKPKSINAPSSMQNTDAAQRNVGQSGFDIPKAYGENIVVVLPVNPHLCFSYWEMTDKIFQTGTNLKARLYDDKKDMIFEFSINDKIGNYYINAYLADKTLQVIIGYENSGKFIALLQSNVIIVPRDYMVYSDEVELSQKSKAEWMKIVDKAKHKQQFSASFIIQKELIKQINERIGSSYAGEYDV